MAYSKTLNWVGSAASYEVSWSVKDTNAYTTPVIVTGTTYVVTGLEDGTEYDVRIVGVCLNTAKSPTPLTGIMRPDVITWQGEDPVCLLNSGYVFYQNRRRYIDGVATSYVETNSFTGGLSTFIPPFSDPTACPIPTIVVNCETYVTSYNGPADYPNTATFTYSQCFGTPATVMINKGSSYTICGLIDSFKSIDPGVTTVGQGFCFQ